MKITTHFKMKASSKEELIRFIHNITDVDIVNTANAVAFMYLITIIFIFYSMFVLEKEITYEYILCLSSPITVFAGVIYILYIFFGIKDKSKKSVYSAIISFLIIVAFWLIMPKMLLPLAEIRTDNYLIYKVLVHCGIALFSFRFFIVIKNIINRETYYLLNEKG